MAKGLLPIKKIMIALDRLPPVMRPSQVADYLRVCEVTVKRWCDAGLIKFTRVGKRGDRRIKATDLNEYLFQYN